MDDTGAARLRRIVEETRQYSALFAPYSFASVLPGTMDVVCTNPANAIAYIFSDLNRDAVALISGKSMLRTAAPYVLTDLVESTRGVMRDLAAQLQRSASSLERESVTQDTNEAG